MNLRTLTFHRHRICQSIKMSPGATMRSRISHIQTRRIWTIHQRMKFLVDSFYLKGEEYGAFLRRNGLYSHDITQWRKQMKSGLDEGRPVYKDERQQYEKRIKGLESELDKAKALNELQKKISEILVEEEEKTPSK